MTLIDPGLLGYLDHEVPDGAILVNEERVEEPVQINPEWLRSASAVAQDSRAMLGNPSRSARWANSRYLRYA
jgi:hypothetical protein